MKKQEGSSTVLNKGYLKTKFEVHATFISWDMVFTWFSDIDPGDLKWPLTFMKNNRDHLLTDVHPYSTFEITATFTSWDIVFTRVWDFDLCWSQMTFDLNEKQLGSSTHQGLSTYQVWSSCNFHLLRYHVYKVFSLWHLKWPLTSMENNRDHLPTKGYHYTRFEVPATFTYWDNMVTSFWPLVTSYDLWPQWKL